MGNRAQRHQGACLSGGTQGPSVPQPPQLPQDDNLPPHAPFGQGRKPGFPNSRPGGAAHQLLSSASKLPFLSKLPRPRWRWNLDFMQMAPGWKDSQNSCAPARPRPLQLPTIWFQPGTSTLPSCASPSCLWRDLWLPSLHCLASRTWCCCGPLGPIPPSRCLMAPRRPLTQCPY